jgi:hypothetical protein
MKQIDTKFTKKVHRIKAIVQKRIPLLLEGDRLDFASILKEQGESEQLYNDEIVNYNTMHDRNKMLFIVKCTGPNDLTIEITITKFKTYLVLKYGIISYDTTTRDSGISVFELFLISLILRFRKLLSIKHSSQTISAWNNPTQFFTIS